MRNVYKNADVLQRFLIVKNKTEMALSYLKELKNAIKADEKKYGNGVMVSDSEWNLMTDEFSGWGALKNITDKSTIADLKAAYIKLCENIVDINEDLKC